MIVADVVVGLVAVALIAAAPFAVRRLDLGAAAAWGVPLVLVLPVLVVVGPRFGTPGMNQALFFGAVAAFAAGSAILVAAGDDGDGGDSDPGSSDPPWWPDFEREFRRYARRRRVRV